MTKQSDILDNKNFLPILNEGFVGIIASMGDDQSIVDAARVSYAKGTKAVSTTRNLIRYLIRLDHSSPIEMAEIKLHVKLPIFVARQWMRHRTFSYNEISYRYSEIEDDMYFPDETSIQPQSSDNKQGREGSIDKKNKKGVKWILQASYEHAMNAYKVLVGNKDEKLCNDFYSVYDTHDGILDDNFPGLARELARTVIPVGTYTEFIVKGNLKNWLHFIKLRSDFHAQYEIRVYSDAIYELLKQIYPLTCEAFEDYKKSSYNLSRMDREFIKSFISSGKSFDDWYSNKTTEFKDEKNLAKHFGMTERELKELKEKVLGK